MDQIKLTIKQEPRGQLGDIAADITREQRDAIRNWLRNGRAPDALTAHDALLEENAQLRARSVVLVEALRLIAAIAKPQMCMDGRAKVGSPNAASYDFQLIARRALAAVDGSKP